ncbi:hypothetical protein Tco_1533795 [Tanacetum coccineum]
MSSGGPRNPFKYTPSSSYSYEPEHKIDPTQKHPLITDMYFKMSWDRYGELSYFEFIWLLIMELQVDREHGCVRVFLYPSEKDFIAGRQFAIFIRKKDLYVVGLHDYRGKIYEIGKLGQYNRYFTYAHQTGFASSTKRYSRVMLHLDDPSAWAWSCGGFALMFSEPCPKIKTINVLMITVHKPSSIHATTAPQLAQLPDDKHAKKGLHFLDLFNDPRIIREQRIAAYKGYRGGVSGQMTYFVASSTLDSAISCVMQGAFCTQRKVSMDKASLVKVPIANVTLFSSAHLLRENTDSVRVPVRLLALAMAAVYASRAAVKSAVSCWMASKVMAGVSDVDVLLGGILST